MAKPRGKVSLSQESLEFFKVYIPDFSHKHLVNLLSLVFFLFQFKDKKSLLLSMKNTGDDIKDCCSRNLENRFLFFFPQESGGNDWKR